MELKKALHQKRIGWIAEKKINTGFIAKRLAQE
jgi:hypothetical protein